MIRIIFSHFVVLVTVATNTLDKQSTVAPARLFSLYLWIWSSLNENFFFLFFFFRRGSRAQDERWDHQDLLAVPDLRAPGKARLLHRDAVPGGCRRKAEQNFKWSNLCYKVNIGCRHDYPIQKLHFDKYILSLMCLSLNVFHSWLHFSLIIVNILVSIGLKS